ncbi:MAG TPA: hypothetical protein VL769_13305 [Acidimicrobiia bacterium]|jgi:hypothetical protein|nr:hypothetical protein [Acidimicrobiia bacterium]
MNGTHSDERSRMNSLDDLELELRKLPGVKAAGFDERDDVLLVQLHVGDRVDSPEHPVPVEASRIVARHIDERTAVEIVRWRTIASAPAVAPPAPVIDLATADSAVTTQPDVEAVAEPEAEPAVAPTEVAVRRARLLAVLAFPDTNELEVHLILDGRRTIGRAVSTDGLVGAVEATLAALREIGAPFEPTPLWVRAIDSGEDERVVVAVALGGVINDAPIDYGMAAGASPIDAAARSTLDALNRRLAQVL